MPTTRIFLRARGRFMWLPTLVGRIVVHQPSPRLAEWAMRAAMRFARVEVRIGGRWHRYPVSQYVAITAEKA